LDKTTVKHKTGSLLETTKWRLARSDVEAAVKLLADSKIEDRVRPYIERFWPSYFGQYEHVYEVAGKIEAQVDVELVLKSIVTLWRYQALQQTLFSVVPPNGTVLDFGCSRGLYAINLHNARPDLSFHGVDIDSTSIDCAREAAVRFGKNPEKLQFVVADESSDLSQRQFHAGIILEVLEHVRDPIGVIEKVERSVIPGGWILISLPSGAVELPMWVNHPERLREHVREFTIDDIWDLFGMKQGLQVFYGANHLNPYAGCQDGCHFIMYQVGGPTGRIDWGRKLSTRRRFAGLLPGWTADYEA
jgi:2-polyprenyl-3-methyl-5-hydroxy-6-metoxy-1,4-benzoquinol methylase